MKNHLLKLIYLRYPKFFQDFMVEDMIGQIPKDVREPSVAFLARSRDTLTRFFLFQSYSIQRRAVADIGNAERFHGMLVYMKFLISLMESAPTTKTEEKMVVEEDKEDPLAGVTAFLDGMRAKKVKK